MRAWLESIAGPEYASALIWTLGALILLLIILVVVRIVRGFTFGTFVAGGRNRKTRLAVMDATAVDSHRRLVLVRRDDVEHLILIGGPTDVVVEQNIKLQSPARRILPQEQRTHSEDMPARQSHESLKAPPAAAEPPQSPAPAPRPAEAPRSGAGETPASMTSRIASALRPSAQTTPAPAASVPSPSHPPAPAATPSSDHAPGPPPAPPVSTASSTGKSGELDDALLKELEVTLGEKSPARETAEKPEKVDDEMSRLLGELSTQRDK
ncbi:MAG: hypothetical protein WDZ83_11725 [Rhizobiaceae bacterium]